MKLARGLIIAVGIAAILLSLIGLFYNGCTLSVAFAGGFSGLLEQQHISHFYAAFYTMSGICILCYVVLIFCGVQLVRLRTGVFPIFVGVLVFEVVYFLSLGFLWLVPGLGMSIGAATGVANGGLVVQGITGFVLWGPIVVALARRRIGRMQDKDSSSSVLQPAEGQPDPLRRKRRRDLWIILLGVVVALLVAVVIGRWPALAAWHEWRMEVAFRQAMQAGPSHAQGDYLESHDFHRRKLVELGYLEHREFQFRYIQTNTPEERQLWKLIRQTFPPTDYINVSIGYYETPTPIVLEVWDRPSRMPLWEAFVKEHDITDFDQRFAVQAQPSVSPRAFSPGS